MRNSFLMLVVLLFVFQLYGQNTDQIVTSLSEFDGANVPNTDTLFNSEDGFQDEWSHLTINSDKRINKLLGISKEENKRDAGIAGYRVQIYQGEKNKAYDYKSEFLKSYPNYNVYVLFKTPDFRVRVGDFRSRSEAIKLKKIIGKDFPGSFIVEDKINFPRLKTN